MTGADGRERKRSKHRHALTDYNEPHLDSLASAFHTHSVTALVGAGSSIACGYPGWAAFLELLESRLRPLLSARYLAQLRSLDVRVRLDKYAQHLGFDYPHIFRATFEPRTDQHGAPEWIRRVLDLSVRHLMTTNYTSELERIAATAHPALPLGETPEFVRWYNNEDVGKALRRNDGVLRLIYLHGRYDDSPAAIHQPDGSVFSKIILGEASYQYAYQFPGVLKERLAAVCQTSTLLIVGASLRDEDITGTLRFARSIGGTDSPHYVILPLRPHETPQHTASEYQARFGLQALFYPVMRGVKGQEDHAALEELLRDIDNRCGHTLGHTPPRLATRPADEPSDSRAGMRDTAEAEQRAPMIVHPLLRAHDFEPRPEYRTLIDAFLDSRLGGVLALCGIGGAGKTAIIRTVVDDLLLEPERHPGAAFQALFVWSFYVDPDVAAFFSHLATYLSGVSSDNWTEASAYNAVRAAYRPAMKLVLVLDGLERIQTEWPDVKQAHGAIPSAALRQFLLWMTQAPVAARTIITTRFPLPELESEGSNARFRLLVVDSLTRRQARRLLQRRGVSGTEGALDTVLDYYGTHALTLDHLAGVLVTYLNSDARRFRELGEGPLSRYEGGAAGARLARVLSTYDRYLSNTEPAVRDTLDRVALFRRPVSARFLAEVFLKGSPVLAGSLAGRTSLDLQRCLTRLSALRLLSDEHDAGQSYYQIHPAIRDAVLDTLGSRRAVLAGAIRRELELSLAPQAGQSNFAQDPQTLDRLEEIFSFCVDEGETKRAFELYSDRLGGFNHLAAIGEYARGERIARRLFETHRGRSDESAARIPDSYYVAIGNDLAQYLQAVGRLSEALDVFRQVAVPGSAFDGNRAYAELAAGYPTLAQKLAKQAHVGKHGMAAMAAMCLARASFCLGDPREAVAFFEDCVAFAETGLLRVRQRARVDLMIALLRCGKFALVLQLLEHDDDEGAERKAWADLLRAEAFRQAGRHSDAIALVERAHEWGLRAGSQELVAFALMIKTLVRESAVEPRSRKSQLLEPLEWIQEALRISTSCGYGLLRIDIEIVAARIHIALGDGQQALQLATTALTMAQEENCRYFWGILAANEVLVHAWSLLRQYSLAQDKEVEVATMKDNLAKQIPFFEEMAGRITTSCDANYGDLRSYPPVDDTWFPQARRRAPKSQ